jgi:hypothetical protein
MSVARSSRWFAAGVAVTLVLGAGVTSWHASASPGPDESTFVPITPTRVLDTRDPIDLGLVGPFLSPVSQVLKLTGAIPTIGGTQVVVPVGASGVTLNVTVVNPAADGFISIRPAGTPGAPTTSSLNFVAGQTTPNAVTVSLPTTGGVAGSIEITYDAYGQLGPAADVLIDAVGYNTRAGITDLDSRLAAAEAQIAAMSSAVSGLESREPRIVRSVLEFLQFSAGQSLLEVTITVPPGAPQRVHITGHTTIFGNDTPFNTCESSFCNASIQIVDVATGTVISPPRQGGSFLRYNSTYSGGSISTDALVVVEPGTYTYRLRAAETGSLPGKFVAFNASLVAQTVPEDGG